MGKSSSDSSSSSSSSDSETEVKRDRRREDSRDRSRNQRQRSCSRDRDGDRRRRERSPARRDRDDRDSRDDRRRRRSRSGERRRRSRSRERRRSRSPLRERERERERRRSRSRSPRAPRSPCVTAEQYIRLVASAQVTGDWRKETRECFKCNEAGHLARDCPQGGGNKREPIKCYKCNGMGHMARDCTGQQSEVFDESKMQYGKPGMGDDDNNEDDNVEKQMPNYEKSGKLLEETNTFKGVVLKYSEPEEARKPKLHWRLYPFKGTEELPVLHIHRQSAYLLGRERRVADIPLDHPSCSQQHAVIQYRLMPYEKADGSMGRRIRPYVIDLGSSNGTMLNGTRVEPQRYYELKAQDCLKFGFSTREYVLMYGEMEVEGADDA